MDMKHIKKFKNFSLIGENIVIVESTDSILETDMPKNILTESVQNIGKDIIKVIPGKDKVFID